MVESYAVGRAGSRQPAAVVDSGGAGGSELLPDGAGLISYLALMTRSNFVACSNGRSPGLAPSGIFFT